jgi:hypothetical protein
MKYLYQIINIPWINSTVDVWSEDTPDQKHRLKVIGFQQPSGCAECKLKCAMISKAIISKDDQIELEKVL